MSSTDTFEFSPPFDTAQCILLTKTCKIRNSWQILKTLYKLKNTESSPRFLLNCTCVLTINKTKLWTFIFTFKFPPYSPLHFFMSQKQKSVAFSYHVHSLKYLALKTLSKSQQNRETRLDKLVTWSCFLLCWRLKAFPIWKVK